MITKRIIPCLDVKDGRVVKGVNFQKLGDVASPVELAKYYSENGADELVFYDITASAEGRAFSRRAEGKTPAWKPSSGSAAAWAKAPGKSW